MKKLYHSGRGRKCIDPEEVRQVISIRLPKPMIDSLDKSGLTRTQIIEQALIKSGYGHDS